MGIELSQDDPVKNRRTVMSPLIDLVRRTETFRRSLPRVVVNAVKNIQTFPDVYKLISTTPFSAALRRNPRLILRPLTQDYLVRGRSVGVGTRCFLYHHRRMQVALSSDFLRQLTLGHVTLYEASNETTHTSVTVGMTSPPHDKEGEWDLCLRVDERPVFLLSFSVVPGWAVGSKTPEVVLISRMQGILGSYPDIKLARKVLADVAPNALLLAALQGIATALGIHKIASVSSTQQTVYREEIAERLHKAYEEFFGDLGVEKNEAGFLVTEVPIAEKPMTAIKAGHKLRTKEKRTLKHAVGAASLELFQKHVIQVHMRGLRLIRQRSEERPAYTARR